ncbi:hypothetical protein [Roseibium sp.]|uniref:hypothetical protein n=1 Tax=Roseibium sp. TaxID=1936156 RepID=UPI003BB10FC9
MAATSETHKAVSSPSTFSGSAASIKVFKREIEPGHKLFEKPINDQCQRATGLYREEKNTRTLVYFGSKQALIARAKIMNAPSGFMFFK